MKSIQQVVREIKQHQRHLDSLCGYDHSGPSGLIHPNNVRDSSLRCTLGAVWHLKVGKNPEHMMLQSCDRHVAMCRKLCVDHGYPDVSIHQFGSSCGLPGSFWLDDYNLCASQDAMWEMGLLVAVQSQIQSEEDPNRCVCNCPACQGWVHLKGECDRVIDPIGYTHNAYTKLTMGERAN